MWENGFSAGKSTQQTRGFYEMWPAETLKLTVGASNEAEKSKSSSDDLHDECEWIDAANVMMMLV